ncbi:glycosyltransferase family 4 protein [Vibrio splendidus]|nr:glycosyltransferase family 4 protein [Vibrio splendidus]
MNVKFLSNLYPSESKPFKGTFVRNVLEGFEKRGGQVSLISLHDSSNSKLGKLIDYIQFIWRSFISGLNSHEGEIHYVHYTSHSSLGLILASFFKSKDKLVIVSNVHGSDILPEKIGAFSKIKIWISQKILNISTLVVSPSGYFKNVLMAEYGVCNRDVIVSPSGGVDASVFRVSSEVNKEFTFGYVGRLEEDKGIFDLLDAFRLNQLENPQSTLVLVGTGSCEARLKDVINSMSGVTILKGMSQRDLVNVYQSLKFLVFPSKRVSESLGLIPIEAMMCGVPVLSSTIGATKDYIVEDMCKLTFEPGRVEELEVALKVATDMSVNDYLRLSDLALETASNYSSSKVIDDLYRTLESRLDTRLSK